MYVADSGSLHAVARPSAALEATVRADEAEQHTADYRHASMISVARGISTGFGAHPCREGSDVLAWPAGDEPVGRWGWGS